MTVQPVAALYVQTGGAYYGTEGVDPWDEARDARNYAGPHPVVAHPPCSRWCQMARLNEKRYGHRVGDDGGCFAHALEAVLAYGGVLEHPAESLAWAHHSLMRPVGLGWKRDQLAGVWVCEVWQSAYGHKARKRTWLLHSGSSAPAELLWERPTGTHQVGWFDRIKPTLSRKEASRTPDAFRDALVALARGSL